MEQITLVKGKDAFLYRKHPWIFSGAIYSDTKSLEDGALVEVVNEKGDFCAIGLFQPGSIAVRIISFEPIAIDQQFWDSVISDAVQLRKQLGLLNEDNSVCRLVHGEGDQLSGLIIDFYNGVAIIQPHAVGMHLKRNEICLALQNVFGDELKAVYYKGKETLPERLNAANEYLFGSCEVPHKVYENGIAFSVNWITGQKTGFFIDQRENRELLSKYSKGKKVLNTFCYSGGFSIYALKAGATHVDSVDSSEKAIALVEANIALHKFEASHRSIVADAVKYMHELEHDYDVIVLDPPAFAKHKNKRHQAIKAYTRLNAHAIRQIKPGGIIFTFSCSQVVDPFQFKKAVIAGAIQCNRKVRILHQLHQPADHPNNAFHPEGEYLKGLVIQVM